MENLSSNEDRVLSRRMTRMFPFEERYDANTKNARQASKNAYNPYSNPRGIINLATAFSYICDDVMATKFVHPDLYANEAEDKVWHVTDSKGHKELRAELASFYTRKFNPVKPLIADDLIISNGVTATLDLLAHCIADPKEVILIPTPAYAYLYRNIYLRAEVEIWPVDLFKEGETSPFRFTPEKVEKAIMDAKKKKVVRGIIIVNPNNPLGEVYSEELIMPILEVCKRYSLHVIFDEISALTVFDEKFNFVSSVSYQSLPDPKRTHAIWSFSKDFSFDGSRVAAIYTQNEDLALSLLNLSYFYFPPTFQQLVCKNLIKDEEWCDRVYFPTLFRRMKIAYHMLEDRLTKIGAEVLPICSGFVVMAYFGKFLKKNSFEEEDRLFQHVLKAGVFITPGYLMYCSQPGWFRIAFSQPENLLLEALDRMEKALADFEKLGK